MKNPDGTKPAEKPAIEGTTTVLNENRRTYVFPNGELPIDNVRELIVRPSGSHRITTAEGELILVAAGWIGIRILDDTHTWTV
jgi:hypothetical protein